jgi:hypothetical protein
LRRYAIICISSLIFDKIFGQNLIINSDFSSYSFSTPILYEDTIYFSKEDFTDLVLWGGITMKNINSSTLLKDGKLYLYFCKDLINHENNFTEFEICNTLNKYENYELEISLNPLFGNTKVKGHFVIEILDLSKKLTHKYFADIKNESMTIIKKDFESVGTEKYIKIYFSKKNKFYGNSTNEDFFIKDYKNNFKKIFASSVNKIQLSNKSKFQDCGIIDIAYNDSTESKNHKEKNDTSIYIVYYDKNSFLPINIPEISDKDQIKKILIKGYASSDGSIEYNNFISNLRAQYIAELLKKEIGIEDIIEFEGKGVLENELENEKNRKVEIIVIRSVYKK